MWVWSSSSLRTRLLVNLFLGGGDVVFVVSRNEAILSPCCNLCFPLTVVFGEDVAFGGVFRCAVDLRKKFGKFIYYLSFLLQHYITVGGEESRCSALRMRGILPSKLSKQFA